MMENKDASGSDCVCSQYRVLCCIEYTHGLHCVFGGNMNLTVKDVLQKLYQCPLDAEVCINDSTYGEYLADRVEYFPDMKKDEGGNRIGKRGAVVFY